MICFAAYRNTVLSALWKPVFKLKSPGIITFCQNFASCFFKRETRKLDYKIVRRKIVIVNFKKKFAVLFIQYPCRTFFVVLQNAKCRDQIIRSPDIPSKLTYFFLFFFYFWYMKDLNFDYKSAWKLHDRSKLEHLHFLFHHWYLY